MSFVFRCEIVPVVKTQFESLPLSPALLGVIRELAYTQPTPIQAASIPTLVAGHDLIGQSKTGSGKTAAFALSILQRVSLPLREVQALVLCPTRELSAQVTREFRTLGRKHPGFTVAEFVGGQPGKSQRDALARGTHVVVGTPGRVLDHLQKGSLTTNAIVTVVLDEADRMLDMGFGPDVETILNRLPKSRQTVLFSATIPKSIAIICKAHMQTPVRVRIDEPEEARLEIRQLRLDTRPDEKFHALCWLLSKFPHNSALIFCNLKQTVIELTDKLESAGLSVGRLDGGLEQFHRDQILARFRNQSVRLLVATDVAGRGIDVEGLDLVINYEFPRQTDIYVHRIGRTGRAGRAGVAISLSGHNDKERIREIESNTGVAIEVLEQGPVNLSEVGPLLRALARPCSMQTILISGGRKDKVRAGDILGALTGDAGGISGSNVGIIEIQDKLSYVAVARPASRLAVQRLNDGRIKGKRFRATLVEGQKLDDAQAQAEARKKKSTNRRSPRSR
ncbi:MAG TPA: ATP-dependent RNA helicase DbpA [Myxococcales bacterium]|nr:ATP-dependent RNA helicase DbpA [Myxococcales bacterium]HIK86766.1 ATP-dependent RNA helicase DbpA [Myxococcales bacterium]